MVNKLKILISIGVLVPTTATSIVATHAYWQSTQRIGWEELNILKENILQNINQNFEINNKVLATKATNEDIKFIGSLPNGVNITTNIISGSANDDTGGIRFNFYLQHNELLAKSIEEIEITGFKTTNQVKKDMINELAALSSFSPINKNKNVKEINDQNIMNEIKWNEQEKFENSIVNYSNVQVNENIGMVTFSYTIRIKDFESNVNQYSAIGWKSIFSNLQEIVKNATFSVKNKELLASQVDKEQIIWDQQDNSNNIEVKVEFQNIKSDDKTGKLGFRATFYKANIKYDLDVELNSDRAITGFIIKK